MNTVKSGFTLRNELKQLATELRNDKAEIKKAQRSSSGEACTLQYRILAKKRTYRHRHIAYCLLRGRTYEQIEPHCRKGNEPDQNLIREIINEYRTDNVCAGS
jgi:hypothetical protein